MDLILEARTGRECVTMLCHGKLVEGKEADTFRSGAGLLIGGFDTLIIDLAGVRAVDAAGVESLASVLAVAMEKGRHVRVKNASTYVAQTLKASRLEECLENSQMPGTRGVGSEAA